jgi:predicted O-methyltransferase YrrM
MTAATFQARYSLSTLSNPGMITAEEEQLYYHLASSFWNPDRFYLEFGTWLGRSTTRICEGLESAAPGKWRLNCYDLFRWNADHIPKAEKAGMPTAVANLKTGDSFKDAFLTLMGGFKDRITTFQGAVHDAPRVLAGAFPLVAKLGVLFVDASKGWDNGQLLKAVAPHLTPGTRIVFQDFFMNSAAFLQLLLMLLPQLQPELVVAKGGSCVFEVIDEIDPEDKLFAPNSIQSISTARIHAACDRLEATMEPSKFSESSLAVTRTVLLWKRGFEDEAHRAAQGLSLTTAQRDALSKRLERQPILKIPPILARV